VRALLIKMSSLGDVVHTLPAVSDAAAHGVTFDWVVEEAFASIPARHPAVRRVVPIAWRRWRKRLVSERHALNDFISSLREEDYDLVIDAQGLMKSAAVTALARAPLKAGLSFTSARESAAAFFYDRKVQVPMGGHAVDRLRALFAGTFGYSMPTGPADFGLGSQTASADATGRCVLLHGTTWDSKHWPEAMWRSLAAGLVDDGWQVALPWGGETERLRAERIAADIAGVRVLDALSLEALGTLIGSAGLVVGVDSGLSHLAGASAVPTVVVYGSTSAMRTGCRGPRVASLQSDLACSPCLRRDCRYRGAPETWEGEVITPACYARVTPERVREQAMRLLER